MSTTYKRGDVHPETGLVFLCRTRDRRDGLRWCTKEQFVKYKETARRKALSTPLVDTPFRKGDVHPETGLVFWGRHRSCKGGVHWMTPEAYEARMAKLREQYRNKPQAESSFKYGEINPETGMVFAGRHRGAKGGVVWATQERFARIVADRRRRTKTPEYLAKFGAYLKTRIATDPLFALQQRVRGRLHGALTRRRIAKNSRTSEVLGCTWEELATHLEGRFKPGMTWENRSLWHVDHIIPLASAETEDALLRLCHYTNLQPLWAEDNLKKSDKIL